MSPAGLVAGLKLEDVGKRSECERRDFLPFDEVAVSRHLEAEVTIGTYATREDDLCLLRVQPLRRLSANMFLSCWKTQSYRYSDNAGKTRRMPPRGESPAHVPW